MLPMKRTVIFGDSDKGAAEQDGLGLMFFRSDDISQTNHIFFVHRCEGSASVPREVLAKCNPCLFKPCHNGGTCGIDDEIEFKCHCPRQYGGQRSLHNFHNSQF